LAVSQRTSGTMTNSHGLFSATRLSPRVHLSDRMGRTSTCSSFSRPTTVVAKSNSKSVSSSNLSRAGPFCGVQIVRHRRPKRVRLRSINDSELAERRCVISFSSSATPPRFRHWYTPATCLRHDLSERGRAETMGSEGPGRGFGSAPERDIDDLPRNDANYTALTPLWFLERAALAQPDRVSVVHGPIRHTWSETYRRCRRLASALSRRSVGHGTTVNLLFFISTSLCD
jgi:hypothetical protein